MTTPNNRSSNFPQDDLHSNYFDLYDGKKSYLQSFSKFFDAGYVADLIEAHWKKKPPYTLLDVGSACGLTLEEFDKLGIHATGIEKNPYIQLQTKPEWMKRNIQGDVRNLPFEANSFDFIYDTCLCYLPENDVRQAVRELSRVTRTGVFWGGITSDMNPELVKRYNLFYYVKTMKTLQQWSQLFLENGFTVASTDEDTLARAWKIEVLSNKGDYPWYPDMFEMKYCFYTKNRGAQKA